MGYNENCSQLEIYIMKRFLCLLIAWLATAPLFAQDAGRPSDDFNAVNLAVTDSHIIPAYAAFDTAATGLAEAATRFCQATDWANLAAFQAGFNASMDAWQGVQHIQFGPITYFNWNYRVHYWPDEKGTGARQLDVLIAEKDASALIPENFVRESVGVQGFPALERLLFEDGSLASLQSDPFRCQVAQTIARNIDEIATGVHSRWVDEFRATIVSADERGFFESSEDATIDFLKAQVESVRRIQQQKLEEVIGETAAEARVRRAESWRSARSLRNLKLNVQALEMLFNGSNDKGISLSVVLHAEDVETINTRFTELNDTFTGLADNFDTVLAESGGHARLLAVAAGLDALFEAFEASLKNTDLYLGFNSLDGD
jgi:predicted lipoprotein